MIDFYKVPVTPSPILLESPSTFTVLNQMVIHLQDVWRMLFARNLNR